MNRTARPTDAAGRALWEQAARERRGRAPRNIAALSKPTDPLWAEALDEIARTNTRLARLAAQVRRARRGIPYVEGR